MTSERPKILFFKLYVTSNNLLDNFHLPCDTLHPTNTDLRPKVLSKNASNNEFCSVLNIQNIFFTMKNQVKRSAVALAVFFMASVSANAQEKVTIGLKTEVNSTFYKYDSESSYSSSDPGLGGSAGAFFKYEFNRWFALQTDLMLHYRNSEMENKFFNEKSKLESYDLELPVYAVFQTKLGTGKIFVGLGPYIGYGISAKMGDIDMHDKEVTGKASMEQLNYGAAAIVGYDFGHFQINASYISQNGIGTMKETSPLRRESLGLGIGFSF